MSIFKTTKNNNNLVSSMLNSKSTLIEDIIPSNSMVCSKFVHIDNLEEINQQKDYNIKLCPRKDICLFYSQIKSIRKIYNIKKSRKNHIDSLVKKAKSKFLKAMNECLKYCLNWFINRLPQQFIINIKIDYNKKYLCLTLEEIYKEFKLLPTYENIIENNLVDKDKKRFLYLLMKSKIKDLYHYYLYSDLYLKEKKKIENKYGIGVSILYNFVATNICEYFLFNKGNEKKISLGSSNNQIIKKKIILKKRIIPNKESENIINNNNSLKFTIYKLNDNINLKKDENEIELYH